jgi:hypothetical protein
MSFLRVKLQRKRLEKKLTCMFNFQGSPATAAGAAWTTTAVCAASATAAHFCPTCSLRQYNYVSITEHVGSKALRNSNNVVSHTLIRCLIIVVCVHHRS